MQPKKRLIDDDGLRRRILAFATGLRSEVLQVDTVIMLLTQMQDVEPLCRWIPVKERLPDLIPCNAGTGYSEAVIILTDGRKVMEAIWDGIDWIAPFDFWDAWGEKVTHWMPLPELPEEEKHE